MEDKYSKMDAREHLNELVAGITRSEQNYYDSDDDGPLDGLEDDEFSLSEEMGLTEIEDYIVNNIWIIESNYVQLRALFLKLYQLRNQPNLNTAEKTEIERLIELIFTLVDWNYVGCAEKAAIAAEEIAAKGRK